MTIPDSTTKQCSKCKQYFPSTAEYFRRNNHLKSGLDSRCKTCLKEDQAQARRNKGIPPKQPPRYIGDNGNRRCTKCLEQYPPTLEYFASHRGFPDNLDLWCKNCSRAAAREYNQEHAEEKRQIAADWYRDNPKKAKATRKDYHNRNRERDNARSKSYYEEHKHDPIYAYKMKQASKLWSEANKERKNESRRQRRRLNPERERVSVRNRRAKIREAEGFHTADDIALIYKSQKGLCWWCGEAVGETYHVDHRISVEKGGSNWPNNLCISCPTCNMSKQDKLPYEWNGRLL